MNKIQNKYRYISTFILAIALAGLIACEGPTGPQGEQGLQGEQGAEGPQGPQGEEGTANVIYSEWIDIDWNIIDGNTVKRMDIDIPQITEEFLEDGGIVLFL